MSVAPPQALRPYYQEGFLIGEDEFNETYTNKEELDLNNRLVAKFKFKNDSTFWGDSEKALTAEELYPQDDEIEQLCKEVSNELYDAIAHTRNCEITGDDYLTFMRKWVDIERLLSDIPIDYNTRTTKTPAGLIKRITDNDLKMRLNKARNQRNMLAHNINTEIPRNGLMDSHELEKLYVDLKEYIANLYAKQ